VYDLNENLSLLMPTNIVVILPGLTHHLRTTSLLPFSQVTYLFSAYYITVTAHFNSAATPSLHIFASPLARGNPITIVADSLRNSVTPALNSVTLVSISAQANHIRPSDITHPAASTTGNPITTTAHPFQEYFTTHYGL
jgi:hypothetical protein